MKHQEAAIYDQLAWLVRSDLPLPKALQQMARDARSSDFQRILERLAEETRSGHSLADAMRRQPSRFRRLYIDLIAAGEQHGFLAQMLHEVAVLARVERRLGHRLREQLIYPILSLLFAMLLFSGFLLWVVPGFEAMYQEFALGDRLPPITRFILTLSNLATSSAILLGIANILVVIVTFWLFSRWGQGAFRCLVRLFPGAGGFWRTLDYSRLCVVLDIAIRHDMPLPVALQTAASLVQSRRLRDVLANWARRSDDGETLGDLMVHSEDVDQLLALTVKHAPEEELATAFAKLAVMYRELGNTQLDRLVLMATISIITISGTAIGLLILALFNPMLYIIKTLSVS